jgi:hypothetical protein
LTDSEKQELINKKPIYVAKYAELFKDDFLRKELSNGTNKYKSVNYRFMMMEKIVKDVLQN